MKCPRLVEALRDEEIIQVATNSCAKHVLALTAKGQVYSWGKNNEGQLGLGTDM